MEITTNLTGERIKKYLSQGKRFDGRKENEFREIKIEKDISKNAEGSVRVNIGKTEVLVGVKLGIGEPYPDSPEKGNLMTTAELLPLSSPRFESGPPKFPAIELARVIDRGIRESKYIDFDKLCIKKGEKVWTVFVDIYTINDDGNLFDAAGIGAITALKNAKMPKYDEETGKILFGEWTDEKVPLSDGTPISITAHKIGDRFIIDPTREEEDVSEVRITAGISNGIISSMQKGNSESLSMEDMDKILDLLEKTERELFKKLEKFLK
ncbi:MAG: exosome complex protein Rrp42 [Nanoarchaeota archaeon]|nr:exosome complex protein Rrp42 [Nanoarchaeota archaeon]MBU4117059.1 exosome complex protein Rrp42 [Nanoarchaeota archaeon]